MKLSKFFEKARPLKRTSKQVISFVNETKEAEFKAEVLAAQNKTVLLEKENNELRGLRTKTVSLETHIQELQKREETFQQTLNIHKVEVDRMIKKVSDHKFLENQIDQLTSTTEIQKNSLTKIIDLNSELTTNVDKLTKQVSGLTTDNQSLQDLERTAHFERISANDRMKTIGIKFDKAAEIFDATQVKYKEGLVKQEDSERKLNYWNAVAENVQLERDKLQETKETLNNILSTLDTKYSDQKGMTKLKTNEITNLHKSILELTSKLDSLTSSNQYLAQQNAYFQAALRRPRYATMSMIEKSEGFKMPMGGSRKHFLGTGKPTLLKFKREGSVA